MADRTDGPTLRLVSMAQFRIAGFLPLAFGDTGQGAAQDQVARGEYLADLGDCASCHTAHDGTKFAGGRYMPTPFGPISTPNITPDKETGIGNFTDDQFYRVLHAGIAPNGEHVYPVMPYPWYTKVTRDDVLAIKAYLFSLKPVHAPRPPNKLAFPFNIRAGLTVWDDLVSATGHLQTRSVQIGGDQPRRLYRRRAWSLRRMP